MRKEGWWAGDVAEIGPFPAVEPLNEYNYSSYEGMRGFIMEFLTEFPSPVDHHKGDYAVLYCAAKMDSGKPPQTLVPVGQLILPEMARKFLKSVKEAEQTLGVTGLRVTANHGWLSRNNLYSFATEDMEKGKIEFIEEPSPDPAT